MAQRPVRLPVVEVPQEPEIVPEQREQPEAAIPQRQGPDLEVLCLFSLSPCVLISHSLPGFLVGFFLFYQRLYCGCVYYVPVLLYLIFLRLRVNILLVS